MTELLPYSELAHLLRTFAVDDLRTALGPEIEAVAFHIAGEVSSSDLIRIAIYKEGKTLLDRKSVRYILLRNMLTPEKLLDLGAQIGVRASDYSAVLEEVAGNPWGTNAASLAILQSVKLPDSYLPDPPPPPEPACIEIPYEEHFYELLDYQFDIKQRVLKEFRRGELARCLVHMPTGTGKTKTAMHIVQEYWTNDEKNNGLIIWIAHTTELLYQAMDTFQSVWSRLGPCAVTMYKFWESFEFPNGVPDQGIVFGGIQKLISLLKKDPDLFEEIRKRVCLIIVDEAHKAPATETHKVISELAKMFESESNRPLLGLTATPGRQTDFDKLLFLFEDRKIDINLKLVDEYLDDYEKSPSVIHHLQRRRILSQFDREIIEIDSAVLDLTPSDIRTLERTLRKGDFGNIPPQILRKIGNSRDRNHKILERVVGLHQEGESTILFACTVAHAKLLSAMFNYHGVPSGCLLGETDSSLRRELIDRFKSGSLSVLVNVGVLTTGFDAPNIDCVFITKPVGSIILYSQMIGRGVRGPLMGGKKVCRLIDVVDNLGFENEAWAFSYFNEYWS